MNLNWINKIGGNRMLISLCALLLCLRASSLFAQGEGGLRAISETAIPYASFLSKASFDQRFPGELKAGPAELDTGWYVIYEHAQLSYYFGPILLQSTGEDYLAQLTKTVEAAVLQRPTIIDYRLELSYEPSQTTQSAEAEASENSRPSGSPPPPPSSSIWTLLRSVFGF